MPLEPGQASLHHVRLFHASPPNRSNDRRIGYAIRYIPTYVRQVVGEKDSATLVRGVDEYGNFDHEKRPDADFSEPARAHHGEVSEAGRPDALPRHRALRVPRLIVPACRCGQAGGRRRPRGEEADN